MPSKPQTSRTRQHLPSRSRLASSPRSWMQQSSGESTATEIHACSVRLQQLLRVRRSVGPSLRHATGTLCGAPCGGRLLRWSQPTAVSHGLLAPSQGRVTFRYHRPSFPASDAACGTTHTPFASKASTTLQTKPSSHCTPPRPPPHRTSIRSYLPLSIIPLLLSLPVHHQLLPVSSVPHREQPAGAAPHRGTR